MLQVTKKAATEAEAEAILTASHQVQKPFSVPVLFIDPADFPVKKVMGIPLFRPVKTPVKEKLAAILAQCDEPQPTDKNLTWERSFFLRTAAQLEKDVIGELNHHWDNDETYMASAMPNASPHLSVVFHTNLEDAARTNAAYALRIDKDKIPDYPGFDAQHNFQSLWHEIAHSVAGDNEAGADFTSAMACRYAFEDCTFLKVEADIRAANAVFLAHIPKILEMYGWPCVDALDSVIAMEKSPDWDDVRKAGEASHLVPRRSQMYAVTNVGKTLRETATEAFNTRDLAALSKAAEQLLQNGAFEKPDDRAIAERFALATRRLSIGTPAYKAPSPQI
jgi:hypothetical protein